MSSTYKQILNYIKNSSMFYGFFRVNILLEIGQMTDMRILELAANHKSVAAYGVVIISIF